MIKEAVKKTSFGFLGLNQAVIGRVNEWLAESGMRAVARLPAGKERAASPLQTAVAKLLMDQGAAQSQACRRPAMIYLK